MNKSIRTYTGKWINKEDFNSELNWNKLKEQEFYDKYPNVKKE